MSDSSRLILAFHRRQVRIEKSRVTAEATELTSDITFLKICFKTR